MKYVKFVTRQDPQNLEHHVLGRVETPAFEFVEQDEVGIKNLLFTPILAVRKGEPEIRSELLDIKVSSESSRLFFGISEETQFKEDLKKRFNHYENKEPRFFGIDVAIIELRQDDVEKEWFPQLAAALRETTVKIKVSRRGESVGHTTGLHCHLRVSSLTAAALVMKAYRDLCTFTKVVAFGPDIFAADIVVIP